MAGAGREQGRVTEDEVRESKGHVLGSVPPGQCPEFLALPGCGMSLQCFRTSISKIPSFCQVHPAARFCKLSLTGAWPHSFIYNSSVAAFKPQGQSHIVVTVIGPAAKPKITVWPFVEKAVSSCFRV